MINQNVNCYGIQNGIAIFFEVSFVLHLQVWKRANNFDM